MTICPPILKGAGHLADGSLMVGKVIINPVSEGSHGDCLFLLVGPSHVAYSSDHCAPPSAHASGLTNFTGTRAEVSSVRHYKKSFEAPLPKRKFLPQPYPNVASFCVAAFASSKSFRSCRQKNHSTHVLKNIRFRYRAHDREQLRNQNNTGKNRYATRSTLIRQTFRS